MSNSKEMKLGATLAERRDEETIDHDAVMERLKADGLCLTPYPLSASGGGGIG